jgi:hypothetical protein
MDKVLDLRPLGKKKTQAIHSPRGATTAHLNSNMHSWVQIIVSFNLAMGQVVGSGRGLKRKGVRLSRFLPRPKPKPKATLLLDAYEGSGPVPTVVRRCSPRPEFSPPEAFGVASACM